MRDLFFSDFFAATNDQFQSLGSAVFDIFYIQDAILKPDAETFLKKTTGLLDGLYDSATTFAPDYDLNPTGLQSILRQGHQAYGSYIDPYIQNIKDSLKAEDGASSLFVKASLAASMVYVTYNAYDNLYNNIHKMDRSQAAKAVAGLLIMSFSTALLTASVFDPSIEVSVYALSAMYIGGSYLWKKGMGQFVDTDLLNTVKTCACQVISAFTPNRVLPTAFENLLNSYFMPDGQTASSEEDEDADAPAPFTEEELPENATADQKNDQMFKMMQHLVKTVDSQAKRINDLEGNVDKINQAAKRDKLKTKGIGAPFVDNMLGKASAKLKQ